MRIGGYDYDRCTFKRTDTNGEELIQTTWATVARNFGIIVIATHYSDEGLLKVEELLATAGEAR